MHDMAKLPYLNSKNRTSSKSDDQSRSLYQYYRFRNSILLVERNIIICIAVTTFSIFQRCKIFPSRRESWKLPQLSSTRNPVSNARASRRYFYYFATAHDRRVGVSRYSARWQLFSRKSIAARGNRLLVSGPRTMTEKQFSRIARWKNALLLRSVSNRFEFVTRSHTRVELEVCNQISPVYSRIYFHLDSLWPTKRSAETNFIFGWIIRLNNSNNLLETLTFCWLSELQECSYDIFNDSFGNLSFLPPLLID